ncbi:hypothetical protein ACO22_05467 [Paracoccidioides brasiliensis]|uniref:Uncharacterized protein n=1 Tax=Paracoccidioides brasiliensis TaxID=121759 RepID=A0A1D2JAD9_PARBR|nr:hypothetical protein ACO22_05467 [Paracoccidioides brasiliensis]
MLDTRIDSCFFLKAIISSSGLQGRHSLPPLTIRSSSYEFVTTNPILIPTTVQNDSADMTQGSQLQTHGQHNSLSTVNMKPNLQGWDKTHVSRGSLTVCAIYVTHFVDCFPLQQGKLNDE